MINSKKLIPALAILITMTFTGITTQAMNESIEHIPNGIHPHVSINETIFTADTLQKVVEIGEDYYITVSLDNMSYKATSNCPHREFMDTGNPVIVYRQYNSSQHEKATRQTMICRKCKKYSTYRYYNIQYFNHSFDKNKVCTFCHYKKK